MVVHLRTERLYCLMMRRHVCVMINIMHLDFMATPQGGQQEELNYCQNTEKLL